uniref:Protein odr-4 homolog n=1 Tax=Chenopodium quinoa TaxID=63459 RepID=A0A803MUY0_CHEQI
MVKAVVGEETRLQLAEDRLAQSAIPAQVGLVIGKLNSKLDRGFIFDLVPTPPNDAGDPPCSIIDPLKGAADKKKVSKPKSSVDSSSLSIDKEWVAEHARQVSRLLVGGVKVVGIYVWVGETSFKNSTLVLCQAITPPHDQLNIIYF